MKILLRWRKKRGLSIALVLSVLLHLLLIVSAMPSPQPDLDPRRATVIELVPTAVKEPEPKIAEKHPEPQFPELPEVVKKQVQRPRLASRLTPPEVVPLVRVQQREHEPEPEVEPPDEPETPPEPLVFPEEIPSTYDAARRHVLKELMTPRTEDEQIAAVVQGIAKEALPPPLNDKSPMPSLRRDDQGYLVHENGALVAKIAPDGSVYFGRNKGASAEGFKRGEDSVLDQYARIPYIPLTRFKSIDHKTGERNDAVQLGTTVRFNSDLNDALLRAKGEDPLLAKKRRFLRLTQKLRDKMAVKHRAKTLSRSKLKAGRHLTKIWEDKTLSFATKRRIIFQMWDECEEPEDDEDNRPEAKAGLRARRMILGFVRKNIPVDGPNAFTPEEVQGFNKKRLSLGSFRPY